MPESDDARARHSSPWQTPGTRGHSLTASSHCCAWTTLPGTWESRTLGVEDISLKAWQPTPHLQLPAVLGEGFSSQRVARPHLLPSEGVGRPDGHTGREREKLSQASALHGSVKRSGTKSFAGSKSTGRTHSKKPHLGSSVQSSDPPSQLSDNHP